MIYLRSISWKKPLPDEGYPYSIPAVRALGGMRFSAPVTFLVGENGCGKSTILEAIAIAWGFNAEGGTKNFNFATRASHADLHEYLRLAKGTQAPRDGFFLRAESFFNVATQVDEVGVTDSYGGRSLHEQSHGEAFLALMNHRFSGRGLYILDEPEAALSPMRQLTMLRRIHDLVRQESQFLIATHSPILMAYPGARILAISKDGFREAAYEETEHYRVTQRFLAEPASILAELLTEDEPGSRNKRRA